MRCLLLSLAIVSATTAWADDEAPAVDPPDRVGQLSFITGNVSFKPAASDDWVTATLNRPITTGDSLWVDDSSRAEIHIGSLAIRLDQYTSLHVLAIDDELVQLGLVRGRASITSHQLDQDEHVEVDLPNAAARIRTQGLYVLSHDEAASATRIAVRRGELDVTTNGHTFDVNEGQSALINGSEDDISYDLRRIANADDFELFARARDDKESNLVATQYVAPEMTGYQSLDEYGSWSTTPEYGAMWYPTNVSAGWVPYRSGHWAYIAPWGWTWVDDMPWGFAPFHYGRWVSWQGRWGWCPGARVARPIYAPALVAWTVGATIGWFPLGPHEIYIPGYSASARYVQRVNVTHVSVVNPSAIDVQTHRYVNRPNAYTVVPERVFTSARPVGPAVITSPGSPGQIVTRVGVRPQRESFAPTYNRASRRPSAELMQRSVMVMHEPVRAHNAPVRGAQVFAPTRSAMPAQPMAPPRPQRDNLPAMRPAEHYGNAPARQPAFDNRPADVNRTPERLQTLPQQNAPGHVQQEQPHRDNAPARAAPPTPSAPQRQAPAQPSAPQRQAPAQPSAPQRQAPAQPSAPQRQAPAQPSAPQRQAPAQPSAPQRQAPAQPSAPRRQAPAQHNAPPRTNAPHR